jgi:YHS domain-containing protein
MRPGLSTVSIGCGKAITSLAVGTRCVTLRRRLAKSGTRRIAPTMTRPITRIAAALLGLLAFAGAAQAGAVNQDRGIALKGYDPVAYFTDHKPVKGSARHVFAYDGGTYEFASAMHQKLFAAAPEKYLPQFDGYCAYGVAAGHKADIDPTAFSIVDGKLYLNYNTKVRSLWRQDIPGNLEKAEDAWPIVAQQTEIVH